MANGLDKIKSKVMVNEPLSAADGELLYATADIFTLGELANLVRERLHGLEVDEERQVVVLEGLGRDVDRRGDADPAVVLGVLDDAA